jgi:flavin reductase (DIM6/NTAB) family NADH-FMN oxidoreductase RutF
MQFDLEGLAANDIYKLLTATVVPRPIAWVVTRSPEGRLNAAPFSFFNAFSAEPPLVAIGIGSRDGMPKDTARNINLTGQFVVNLVPEQAMQQMNVTAIDFQPDVSEVEAAALETLPSARVAPPRLAASPVHLECERMVSLEVGVGRTIVIGRVLVVHVRDEAVLDAARCHIDTPALGLVGRMHGAGWYARTSDLVQMLRLNAGDFPIPEGGKAPPDE